MARPQRLSREKVVGVAIALLDEEGVQALSVERIANELGARGPSLYHHYRDKSAILDDIAAQILGRMALDRQTDDVTEWLVEMCLDMYGRVMEHPNVAYLLLEHLPLDAMLAAFGRGARLVANTDVPVERQLLLLMGTQHIVWGAIAYGTIMRARRAELATDPAHWPELADAQRANAFNEEEMLEQAVRAFVSGVLCLNEEVAPSPQQHDRS